MRLIDADNLKECFRWSEVCRLSISEINKIIDNAPTVELFCSYLSDGEVRQPCVEGPCEQERSQGEWIIVTDKYGENVKCPFCGKEIAGSDLNYCVKCGADMQKGGAE